VAGCHERAHEPSGFIKCSEFFDKFGKNLLLKAGSVPCEVSEIVCFQVTVVAW
jgi:hypothetical protein